MGGADNTCGECAKFCICRTVGEPGFSADCRAHICPDVSANTCAHVSADFCAYGLTGADRGSDNGADDLMQDPDSLAKLSGDRRHKF